MGHARAIALKLAVTGLALWSIWLGNHVVANEVSSAFVREKTVWIAWPTALKQSCVEKLLMVELGSDAMHAAFPLKRVRYDTPLSRSENEQFVFEFMAPFGWLKELCELVVIGCKLFRARSLLQREVL